MPEALGEEVDPRGEHLATLDGNGVDLDVGGLHRGAAGQFGEGQQVNRGALELGIGCGRSCFEQRAQLVGAVGVPD
ncbi:hypothetical protein [Nocardia sp. NBC_00403]|uniref:hypothetical protein n=1 Tax=Nocardia sp. NBC_00403 TaxID=2975990 RepID=UPI002E1C68AB